MLPPWHTGKIISIEDATANTKIFKMQVNNPESFDFIPGQFVTLDLPIHEKKNKRWRSYSIASYPDGTNIIELVISYFKGGAGSTFLFNDLREGDEILFRGPQGNFILPPKIDKDLFLVCTGTGIAPFWSMVQHIYRNKIQHKNIFLIFGFRKTGDSLYAEELKKMEKELNNFYYLPVFSREPEENVAIKKGYVHAVYEEIIKKQKPEAIFYLCGWKNMVDDAQKKIIALGYDKKDIRLELYG